MARTAIGVNATSFVHPDWPMPAGVRAVTTTRAGGVSEGVYAALNLGDHVGDAPAAVARNRAVLHEALALPCAPAWLKQVHGTDIRCLSGGTQGSGASADAAFTTTRGVVCAVLTADCLPVLFCNERGTHVAAAHAGWRGLAAGALESTIAALAAAGAPAATLRAWLGPAIGPAAYEVGDDVREAFLRADVAAEAVFTANRPRHWLLDLYAAARQRLQRAGVTVVRGGEYCTLTDSTRFFSHRRDGVTGRQATLIWRE